MKIVTESENLGYGKTGNYIIHRTEGIQTGIFFRFPIRKICHKVYSYNKYDFSLAEFVQTCKDSRLFRWANLLLGNKNAVDFAMNDVDFDLDLYGIDIKRFISPIYFKRNFRELDIISMDDDNPINYVSSFGYDDKYTDITGNCNLEKTVISYKYKRKVKFISSKRYKYTYTHIAKELIKILEINPKDPSINLEEIEY